ncbi:HNH endonuclease [Pseudomonas synxantha]|uniref:HNH endonuclease n=1 Tax=Pseudomonas synxantha TaxID=47883 RepID=UPI001652BFEA|nr:HNH endonuclease [Pseudomonas synxantha]
MIQLHNNSRLVALHVSTITGHSRRDYELRFQNPAGGALVSDDYQRASPVLLGLDDPENPRIFVAVDGRSRVNRGSRFSILFHQRIIAEARNKGWAEYVASNGEKVYAFVPSLFPAFLSLLDDTNDIGAQEVAEIAEASGVLDAPNDAYSQALAASRAYRAVTVLARKAGSGRQIRSAYGHRCAMCGLGSNLLQGAHIFPVEAPGSTDDVWNGLSLCYNHHRAFDLHLIWVDPNSYEIRLHPSLHQDAFVSDGGRRFVEGTWLRLGLPIFQHHYPLPQMFTARYDYFEDDYSWV